MILNRILVWDQFYVCYKKLAKFSVPISSFMIRRIVFQVKFDELIAEQLEEYLLLPFY